jgi:ABC-type Zn2+ transport system substrate-binding protein/surface adhesin
VAFRTILTLCTLLAVPLFLGCKDTHDHGEGAHHDEAAEGPGHDHDGEDHDDGETHAHDNAHAAGPHGGHVYVLGDDAAHAELAHADGKITAWVTSHEGEPLDAGESIMLQLFSDGEFVDFTLKKTADGAYELADTTAYDLLEKTKELKGRLHATIDGKKITGVLEHHAH